MLALRASQHEIMWIIITYVNYNRDWIYWSPPISAKASRGKWYNVTFNEMPLTQTLCMYFETETPILWFHCDMFLFLLQSYRFLNTAGQWLDWVVRHSIVEILPIRFPRQSAYWSKLSTNYVTNDQPTSQGKPPRRAFDLIVWTCKQVKMTKQISISGTNRQSVTPV